MGQPPSWQHCQTTAPCHYLCKHYLPFPLNCFESPNAQVHLSISVVENQAPRVPQFNKWEPWPEVPFRASYLQQTRKINQYGGGNQCEKYQRGDGGILVVTGHYFPSYCPWIIYNPSKKNPFHLPPFTSLWTPKHEIQVTATSGLHCSTVNVSLTFDLANWDGTLNFKHFSVASQNIFRAFSNRKPVYK